MTAELTKITIIGVGSLGKALAGAISSDKLPWKPRLHLIDRKGEKVANFAREMAATSSDVIDANIENSDVLIISVKPQDSTQTLEKIKAVGVKDKLIISTMAGVTLKSLIERLPSGNSIVRCMPNLPVSLRMGVSALFFEEELPQPHKDLLERIVTACGDHIRVDSDKMIDAATVLSGSGPGILSYYIQLCVRLAQEMGFSEEDARRLTLQTMHGCIHLLLKTGESEESLISRVASKGGTTEAMLSLLQDKKQEELLREALAHGFKRAQSLSENC